ncbi:hypothetical protein C1H46_044142 [Malus baccata]|uniref:Uncharacterized protein n=1 Tax=Malus baccata TaxID=106549 RepID=A0A540K7X3_MALBA|nr:hypothetical protein C1H46_044142 [Malus baccata]
MASSFSNNEVFQVQEGKGIQEERGVLNTLGHLNLILKGVPHQFQQGDLFSLPCKAF